MELENYFEKMWKSYIELIPQASKIKNLLEAEGESITNDHIALRTFNLDETSIDVISQPFLDLGYIEKGEYHFKEKKLYAKHYEYPGNTRPKIFISELLVKEFSLDFQNTIRKIVKSKPAEFYRDKELMLVGRPWELSHKEYLALQAESDYGAWLAALGFRPNHFTISVNHLKKYTELTDLNNFLKLKGFELNSSGGEIKGSQAVCLEQSSTLADSVKVKFSDISVTIPSCYFEFAKRYVQSSGELYTGFVAQSADKIFESTDKGQ